MKLHANCKINIGLNVLCRRDDGYHEIETAMIPVSKFYDDIEVVRTDSGISFRQTGIGIDCPDEQNLCVRAARLMQERYGTGGVDIALTKRVPFGAGLGGGSSDATAVIRAINKLYNLALSDEELISAAAALGSDTAFFVHNTPQICRGRGETMEPVKLPLKGLYLVVVKPKEGVSTAEAYRGVRPAMPEIPLVEALKRPVTEWSEVVKNDFEEHIFRAHPDIARLKQKLVSCGALYASMSGSGSALFGLFDHEPPHEELSDTFIHIEQF